MRREIFKNISVLFLMVFLLASCIKDKPQANTNLPPNTDSESRVLIVCEGSLGNGNGELGLYLPQQDSVYNNIYSNIHQRPLGDVFQSITRINGFYFLCINNSDKIVVLDRKTWQEQAQILLPKPRYLLDIGNNKAYVGSLFDSKIYVVNTQNFSVERSISMPYQNTEGLLLQDGLVYACCWDTACQKVYVLNPFLHQIVDSIAIMGRAPQSIHSDHLGQLWIMGGNSFKNKTAYLSKVDAKSKKVIQHFNFGAGVEAIKPNLNPTKDTLYFLKVNYNGGPTNNGVFAMPVAASNLPSRPIISGQSNQYFWALGIHPKDGNIYLGDPKGFVQKSSVTIYKSNGQAEKQFGTGVGVGSFYFD